MKHLRRIFESTEETMIEDLKDILLDLDDIGFETNVVHYKYIERVGVINITISKSIRKFWNSPFIRDDKELRELKSVIDRIVHYARINDYLIDTTWLDRLNSLDFTIEQFNRVLHTNRNIIYFTIYPNKDK